MIVTNRRNTKFGNYEGFSTYLLIGEINSGSKEISIQITDVEPDEMQFIHSHAQEQCYYIIAGSGLIFIDDLSKEVKTGDAVFIPSGAEHGIRNTGKKKLTYLTANKAFGELRENEIWPEEKAE